MLLLLFHECLYLGNTNLDGETKKQSVVCLCRGKQMVGMCLSCCVTTVLIAINHNMEQLQLLLSTHTSE